MVKDREKNSIEPVGGTLKFTSSSAPKNIVTDYNIRVETTSSTTNRLGHDTRAIGELKVGLCPRLTLWLQVFENVSSLNVVTNKSHVLKRLLKAVTENHDVGTGVECSQPQCIGHEEHRFAVVTRCFDHIVTILI